MLQLQQLVEQLPFELLAVIELVLLPFAEQHTAELASVAFDKTVASIASATFAASA